MSSWPYSPDAVEPARKKAKNTKALEVIMVFDAEADPAEPEVYIMPFARLSEKKKSWLQLYNGKYTPFHMIDEEHVKIYKSVVKKVRKSKYAMRLGEWLMLHGDFEIVSSFTWTEHWL